MKAKTFEDLKVWEKAHQFVLQIYRFTKSFPKHEQFGLVSQVRRAAISVPANIAEGFKKKTRLDKLRFFNIAQGSIEEVRYYMILSQNLGYGDTQELKENLSEVSRMLGGYMKSIKKNVD